MFAIGFVMLVVFLLMATLNSSVKEVSGGYPPAWYAVTGSLLFIGGILLMLGSLSQLLWRAFP